MKPILMVDLATQYQKMRSEMDAAISKVVRSGEYINGKAVQDFSSNLAAYTGARYVIPCANGTDALQIALMALGLQPGDEVIIPDFTYIAAAEVIALLKLTPVPVDVNPETFNIDIEKMACSLSLKTKAIVPVHLFGQCSDMAPILKFAKENALHIVEDNAQSIGSIYTFPSGERQQAGTIGDAGALSFFPTKNLGCYGDGGALLTGNENLARKMRMIASHGQSQKYLHELIGCNSRLDTLQAAVLNVKLPYLDAYIHSRQKVAQAYNEALEMRTDLYEIPKCIAASTHVYHQYTLKVKQNKRDALQKYLKERKVPSIVYYPNPLHRQPAFRGVIRIGSDLSETEKLCKSALSLPIYPELSEEQIHYITGLLVNYE
ncbi:MAG: DegT/DnrJ/EryC1/StrS family aminotransferase [Dysgonamonadaceae bacterium]|jgi:dTDP-4-amino-4,6-dideoxygalactose transaminase|nr:DegT/DnrJ/EryC1/StrS family aminotransferase [Dysgonamonadaceae bacterium]